MENNNLSVFKPLVSGNVNLKNRFIRAAANEKTNDQEIRNLFYGKLSDGGAALILTGGLTSDKFQLYKSVADIIHKNNSKFAIQIVYPNSIRLANNDTDFNCSCVSELKPDNPIFDGVMLSYVKNHEMTETEIWDLVKYYALAAKSAVDTGADIISIHSAHQNILLQFLSPITNQRSDKWGGSIENRTRIHCEIIKAIKTEIGSDIPVMIKVGIEDSFDNGLKEEEGIQAAGIISKSGYDIIEISQGLMNAKNFNLYSPMRSPIKDEKDEIFFREWAKKVKEVSPVPVMVTGGVRSLNIAEDVIANNEADLLGLCRPLLREPDLVNRWKSGNTEKAHCKFCNSCLISPNHSYLECNFNK